MATLVLCKSPSPRADSRAPRCFGVSGACSRLTILLLPDQLLILQPYLCSGKFSGADVDFMISELHFWHLYCRSEDMTRFRTWSSWSHNCELPAHVILASRSRPFGLCLGTLKQTTSLLVHFGLFLIGLFNELLFRTNCDWHDLGFSAHFTPFVSFFITANTVLFMFADSPRDVALHQHGARHGARRRGACRLCMLICARRAQLSGGGDVGGESNLSGWIRLRRLSASLLPSDQI